VCRRRATQTGLFEKVADAAAVDARTPSERIGVNVGAPLFEDCVGRRGRQNP
jgi:hypothetical protein